MEGASDLNEQNINNVSGVGKAEEKCATSAGNDLEEKITSLMAENENFWRTVSEKQLIIGGLRGEQTRVSDKFTRFFDMSRHLEDSISEDLGNFHQYTEINEQVQLLAHFLSEFELKLQRSEKIVHDLIRDMRSHFAMIKTSVEAMKGSANVKLALESVQLPSLQWTSTVPDPEVEMLSNEWEVMQLDDKMTQHLVQMQSLVESSGIGVHPDELMDDEYDELLGFE